MKAVTFRRYGSPDVIALAELDTPVPSDDQVLVKVHAASVNPLDWHRMRGQPYILRLGEGRTRPKNTGLGADVAGVVESAGAAVTKFRPGDEVFGMSNRTFAEYVRVSEQGLAARPAPLSFVEAAAVPVAATTALQALRDTGRLEPGQSVLVIGASGGVGTFAVQIAKALGGKVTGVCSTANVELVRSLGADDVIDYKRDDFTKTGRRFDLILDCVGERSVSAIRRVLAADGALVTVGGGSSKRIGPLIRIASSRLASRNTPQRLVFMMSHRSAEDLLVLKDLIEAGKLRTVIDRTYPLEKTAEAVRYLEAGHARGKVVVTVP